jgi:hypothetical protein
MHFADQARVLAQFGASCFRSRLSDLNGDHVSLDQDNGNLMVERKKSNSS